MPRKHIRERIPKDLYDDLYNRRKTVREVAKLLNLNENYLSHAIPERAPKRNSALLRATRELFQANLAKETIERKHRVRDAADLAHVSERTMYRRMKKVRQNNEN